MRRRGTASLIEAQTTNLPKTQSNCATKKTIPRLIQIPATSVLMTSCDSRSSEGDEIEDTLNEDNLGNLPKDSTEISRLDRVMGTMLETWQKRYTFKHNREESNLTFEAPGFTLTVIEKGEGEEVAILFEEAGKKHKAVCTADEAPLIIEALLFPQPESE